MAAPTMIATANITTTNHGVEGSLVLTAIIIVGLNVMKSPWVGTFNSQAASLPEIDPAKAAPPAMNRTLPKFGMPAYPNSRFSETLMAR